MATMASIGTLTKEQRHLLAVLMMEVGWVYAEEPAIDAF
jgi:hypothetical protein